MKKEESKTTLKARLSHYIDKGVCPFALVIVRNGKIAEFYDDIDIRKIARGHFFAAAFEVVDFAVINRTAIAIVAK